MSSVFKLPESTEKAFFDLFMWPRVSAKIALEDELPKLLEKGLKINIYYGTHDWMDAVGMKKLLDN